MSTGLTAIKMPNEVYLKQYDSARIEFLKSEQEKELNELAKEITELLQKQRPEKIDKLQYGQYSSRSIELLYNDGKKEYEQLNSRPENKTVGSVKAFAACIKEELKRRDNQTGHKATVRIYSKGG